MSRLRSLNRQAPACPSVLQKEPIKDNIKDGEIKYKRCKGDTNVGVSACIRRAIAKFSLRRLLSRVRFFFWKHILQVCFPPGCIVLYHENDSFELRGHRWRCYRRLFTDPETLLRRSESRTWVSFIGPCLRAKRSRRVSNCKPSELDIPLARERSREHLLIPCRPS